MPSSSAAARTGLSMRLRLTLLVVVVFGVISVTLSILRLLYLNKQVAEITANQQIDKESIQRLLVEQMRDNIVVSTPIALLAAAVAGWFVAGFAVRPYQKLSEFMRTLRPESVRQGMQMSDASSEVKRLQEDLNDALHRLDAGYQAQERFTANVSHELKTPIATILTEAQTLKKHDRLPDDVSRFIRSTEDEMRRLGKIVESFLLLSRVRDGKAALAGQRLYPLNELVMESAEHCKPFADAHDVSIHIRLQESADGSELRVFGEPELLRTMIDNVIRNAIRFSPREGAVDVRVDTATAESVVAVCDKGPAIPDHMIGRIFDRFINTLPVDPSVRGNTLGLEIAQGIAELHNGRISAENLPDKGCCFTIRLPLHQESPEA
jgi:signal transduction histidine kinase